jgi:hypothetical protein
MIIPFIAPAAVHPDTHSNNEDENHEIGHGRFYKKGRAPYAHAHGLLGGLVDLYTTRVVLLHEFQKEPPFLLRK